MFRQSQASHSQFLPELLEVEALDWPLASVDGMSSLEFDSPVALESCRSCPWTFSSAASRLSCQLEHAKERYSKVKVQPENFSQPKNAVV